MASIPLKSWDRLFLKPINFVFFIVAIKYFFDGRWGLGIFLVIAAILGVGGIGQGLYPELSTKELATGGMDINVNDSTEISNIESRLLLRAVKRLTYLVFIVTFVIEISSNVPFVKSIGVSLLNSGAILIAFVLFVLITGLIARSKLKS